MEHFQFIQRELTLKEAQQIEEGFDNLYKEEGIALESTEKKSIVVMKNHELIGCALGLAYKNGEMYSGWFYLTELFIAKEFRSQGIGAALLRALEDEVKQLGINKVWLWTSGAASLRFYKRMEYSPFAELENWYSDGSTKVGLRKNLTA